MKIAIYANELNNINESGVKVYTREIIRALIKADHNNTYYAYMEDKSPGWTAEVDNLGKECGLVIRKSKSRLPLWTYLKFPSEIKKNAPDVLFLPIQVMPFLKKPKEMKVIVTVHDIAFRLFPDHFKLKKRYLLDFHTKRAALMADHIIAPSIATKNDIIKFYGINEDQITVINHGFSKSENIPLISKEEEQKIESFRPYILFTGAIQPRKNISSLISAFEMIKSISKMNLKLVISGPKGWLYQETLEKAKRSQFKSKIIFTGNVSDACLDRLYKKAMVFVMPSLYEGFGLPVVEAMGRGLPCAISNNSSLSEIGKGAALFFNAEDISDIANKITMFLDDEKLRAEYSRKSTERAKLFSWEKAARLHMDVFLK